MLTDLDRSGLPSKEKSREGPQQKQLIWNAQEELNTEEYGETVSCFV